MLKNVYKIPKINGHSSLEIQIANGCNFTCQSCSHYTNVGGGKNLNLETFTEWCLNWNKKIVPENFIIMGGEPTINNQLVEIVKKSLILWKNSNIKIITNGFFLEKHIELPTIMHNSRIFMELSLKSDSKDYLESMAPVFRLIEDWKKKYQINIKFRNDYKSWLKIYNGYGKDITPFNDGNPKKSYEICGQKVCRVLHENCLWKCPRLAYLNLYNKRFKSNNAWDPYLEYKPIMPNAKMKEIKKFFEEKEIFECSMCPSQLHYINDLSPMKYKHGIS